MQFRFSFFTRMYSFKKELLLRSINSQDMSLEQNLSSFIFLKVVNFKMLIDVNFCLTRAWKLGQLRSIHYTVFVGIIPCKSGVNSRKALNLESRSCTHRSAQYTVHLHLCVLFSFERAVEFRKSTPNLGSFVTILRKLSPTSLVSLYVFC